MDSLKKTRRILFIDDDEVILSIAEIMLETEYEIITAKSGKEALNYLLQGVVPDLILLDVLMPDMDGWETYNRLRAISFLQDVPIAFVTSLDGLNEKNHALEIGAADYILKPFKRQDLIKKIEVLIEKNVEKKPPESTP